jgi:hypothetical protein
MPTLQYVQPTDEQKAVMQTLRDEFEVLYRKVEALESIRGRSIALTKLEEAAMWVNKAITLNS